MAPRQGYPRGYCRGGHSPPTSSSRQTGNEVLSSRLQREAFTTTHSFFTTILSRFQDHVEEAEAAVQQERSMHMEQEVAEATIHWVPNVGASRARDTKYWKTAELYWHIKNLLGQMVQTREEAMNTMQLQMDGFHMMMCEVLARMPLPSTMVTPLAPHSTANSAPEQTEDRSVMLLGP